MADKFPFFAAVYLVLQKDTQILLSRRFNTGYEDGMYSMVAGHMDGGESVIEATRREAREEAGLEIAPENLTVAHTMHRICASGVEYIDFFVVAHSWHGEPSIMEPDKCDDMSWHPLTNLPDTTLPYIRAALTEIERGNPFSDFVEATQV